MRYQDPQLLDRLAAEHVLGTLHGRARRRFERLAIEQHPVRAAIWAWEQRLSPLAHSVRSVQPGAQVWRRVLERTGGVTSAPRWQERLGLWRGLSLAAMAAAIVMAIMLTLRPADVPAPQYVAVVNNEQSQPVWVVSADVERGRLSVRPINVAAAPNNAYELWVLPAGGAAPRSLGVLPVGGSTVETVLPAALGALLENAQGLAVSLEPPGGSPTGAPTGPVLYQAPMLRI